MRILVAALFSTWYVTNAVAAENIVEFEDSGKLYVLCACVEATSGCTSKMLDAAAGRPRVSWSQVGTAKAGVNLDLSKWCYRRRDTDGPGTEFCCSIGTDYEADSRFFWGELDRIE